MPRYKKTSIVSNDTDYYEFLRKKRNIKRVIQYETPALRNPTAIDRALLVTTVHIWKYGDRLYKLADQYYNDSRFWWVIAWYNGYGTEADIRNGNVIRIPLNLADVLTVLGAS